MSHLDDYKSTNYSTGRAILPDYEKDSASTINYTVSFAKPLDGETISSRAVDGDGLTVVTSSNTGSSITARFSGGSEGKLYEPKFTATSSGSQVIVRRIRILVREQ